jgi:AcrR family transcriptional regulator
VATESLFSAPKQRRSREALDRVLEAATELLKEVGYDAMRIAEVGERANVGAASIYARVGSKHGLLLAVQSRMLEEMERETHELIQPLRQFKGPFDALVIAAVTALGEVFRRHEALLRVMMIRADVDESIIEHASASSVAVRELFAGVLLDRRDEIAHPDVERAVDVSFRFTYDTLARRVVRGATFESDRDLSWDDQVAELGVAAAAYLTHATDVISRRKRRRRTRT